TSTDPQVLAAGLDYAEGEEDLALVRGAARHPGWRVREAAARALGRVGDRHELAVLLGLLRDPQWWVRYHAAHSLTQLHGLEAGEVEALRGATPGASPGLERARARRRGARRRRPLPRSRRRWPTEGTPDERRHPAGVVLPALLRAHQRR